MATSARAVSVTTGATRLDTIEGGSNRVVSCAVYNNGTATVYLGGSGVTAAAGYPLGAGLHMSFPLDSTDGLFGVAATGTVEVRVVETGV